MSIEMDRLAAALRAAAPRPDAAAQERALAQAMANYDRLPWPKTERPQEIPSHRGLWARTGARLLAAVGQSPAMAAGSAAMGLALLVLTLPQGADLSAGQGMGAGQIAMAPQDLAPPGLARKESAPPQPAPNLVAKAPVAADAAAAISGGPALGAEGSGGDLLAVADAPIWLAAPQRPTRSRSQSPDLADLLTGLPQPQAAAEGLAASLLPAPWAPGHWLLHLAIQPGEGGISLHWNGAAVLGYRPLPPSSQGALQADSRGPILILAELSLAGAAKPGKWVDLGWAETAQGPRPFRAIPGGAGAEARFDGAVMALGLGGGDWRDLPPPPDPARQEMLRWAQRIWPAAP